jgi:hypothetical protein
VIIGDNENAEAYPLNVAIAIECIHALPMSGRHGGIVMREAGGNRSLTIIIKPR